MVNISVIKVLIARNISTETFLNANSGSEVGNT